MMTVEPLPRVTSTFPPGFSRMNAPPPSDALISATMGVGSAVIVEVGDSVGGSVASSVMGLDVGVRDGVSVSTPNAAVAGTEVDVGVMVGISDRVGVV